MTVTPQLDLVGRDDEFARLHALLDGLPQAGSALVIRGDAGIGKTCLLHELAEYGARSGVRVLTLTGVEPEAHLPFAGLQQLLAPVWASVDLLPASQRRALLSAFEIEDGPAPQPFLVALAALGLLTEAANNAPLLVVVDDAQWLDSPTYDALSFVARRIHSEAVVLVATVRSGYDGSLTQSDIPVVDLQALDDQSSRHVLARHGGHLDALARSRILLEAKGNPLALVELPQAWRTRDLSDGFVPLNTRLERAFAARLDEVPPATRDALLVAATHDDGAIAEILAAAALLADTALDIDVLEPAAVTGLISYDARLLRFRHPLVRSGILQAEPLARRHAAHSALADVMDNQDYRSIWHRAQAIVEVDDEVADLLEQSHAVALRRGSVASAIEMLGRAAQLTSESRMRGRRLLMAAEHAFGLGRADLVDTLITAAEQTELSELDRARTEWLREIFNDGVPGDGARIMDLCAIAERSAVTGESDLALNLLLGAALRTWWADAGADIRAHIVAVAEQLAARVDDFETDPRFVTTLGVADPVPTAPRVQRLLGAVAPETLADPDALRLYGMVAHAIGDPELACDFLGRAETRLREEGRLGLLSHVLTMQILDRMEVGDWDRALLCMDEGRQVAADTGQPIWDVGTLSLCAIVTGLRGEYDEAIDMAARAEQIAGEQRLNDLLACVQLARGFAAVATGRFEEGYVELERLFDSLDRAFHVTERFHGISLFAEAAVHAGRVNEARGVIRALEVELEGHFVPAVRVHLGYARAVLCDDDEAGRLFESALAEDLTGWPWHRARLELAYGSWLRRQRRVADARRPLRSAQVTLALIGAVTWAERAKEELRAAGDAVEAREQPRPHDVLSAQELQIARLAAEGMTNREIGERMFLSPRTVGSHLYRIFPKLDISSRGQLQARLAVSNQRGGGELSP